MCRRDASFVYAAGRRTIDRGTRLAGVDVASMQDDAVAHLMRAKARELDLQIEMLSARTTPSFRTLSVELYGSADAILVEQAEQILATVPAPGPTAEGTGSPRPTPSRNWRRPSSITIASSTRTCRCSSRSATTAPR